MPVSLPMLVADVKEGNLWGMPDRQILLDPSVAIDTTPNVLPAVEVRGFGQLAFEIATGTMVGALKLLLEFSPDGDGFFPESVEDTSGTSVAGELEVPISRVIRTFDASDSTVSFVVPCAGYSHIRISVYAGTSGHATIFLTKLRLAAN